MSQRAEQLHITADGQIAELIELVATFDDSTLQRPCLGREKLGDGTVGANAQHTADNYQRIAAFVETSGAMSGGHARADHGAHQMPGFLRRLGHRPPAHDDHGASSHAGQYTADGVDPVKLVQQLSASREALAHIAALSDSQLDAIPPNGRFRFCDGQRTLEQVLASLLKHQSHQVQAVRAALA